MELLTLTERVEQYDPRTSPDNRGDELALHQDIVTATGIGSYSPAFEATFLRSIDAAMSLVPEGWHWNVRWHAADREGRATVISQYASSPIMGRAATPALALTAASLRARALAGRAS